MFLYFSILHLDFNSQFTAHCIPNVNFLIFLHFAFWIPLDFSAFCILDSNCQCWVPIVNCLTILRFGFWVPIVNFVPYYVLHFGFQLSIFIPFCVLHFWIQELMSGKRKYTLTQVGGGGRGIVNSGYGACTFRPTFRAHFRVMNINTCHSNF